MNIIFFLCAAQFVYGKRKYIFCYRNKLSSFNVGLTKRGLFLLALINAFILTAFMQMAGNSLLNLAYSKPAILPCNRLSSNTSRDNDIYMSGSYQ